MRHSGGKRRNDNGGEPVRNIRPKFNASAVNTATNNYNNKNNNGNNNNNAWNNNNNNSRNNREDAHNNHHNVEARIITSKPLNIAVEKPIVDEVHLKPDSIQRNKRMFAGLMGHLDLAKRRLANDPGSLDQRKQAIENASSKNDSTVRRISDFMRKKSELEKQKVTINILSHYEYSIFYNICLLNESENACKCNQDLAIKSCNAM